MPDRKRIQEYFLESLQVDRLIDIELLLLTFATGIQDAISFPDFHCFASNQTGNSVVLAVGLAGIGGELFSIVNVSVSLGMFISGSIITGQIANLVGARRRVWLLVSHTIQTLMVYAAAAVMAVYGVQFSGPSVIGSIALLAFSSGAQVASMRPMKRPEITTAMATAAWVDLLIDPKLLSLRNRSRDRRALFLLSLVVGSFAGAFMHVDIGSSNALLVCAAGKTLVTVGLFFNRPESRERVDESGEKAEVFEGQIGGLATQQP